MLRTFALALTVPLVSAAHGLHNPWIHGVSGCTKTECCAEIKTGLCKGNTCNGVGDPTECRGRVEPDINCGAHPYLKTDKAPGTVGRTYTACCKSMCSTYDRCNKNDEVNTNTFGHNGAPKIPSTNTQTIINGVNTPPSATWEANLVKGSRAHPVAVDAGTALGNEPQFYYNKYKFGAARKTQAALTVLPTTQAALTCPPTDVQYEALTAKTTCCAATCNNFRLITSITATGGQHSARSFTSLDTARADFCQHPAGGLLRKHPDLVNPALPSTTDRYTEKNINTECAGITCTLEECCTANKAPAPAPPKVQKITTPKCKWNGATAGICGAAIPATATGTRAVKRCGSGGMARSTITLQLQAAMTTCCMADAVTGVCAGANDCGVGFTSTRGTCTIPAGYSADTTFNTKIAPATDLTLAAGGSVGFKVYKDEPCCLKDCGVDCVGAMQRQGCSVKCGTGTEQEMFVETTKYKVGQIACTANQIADPVQGIPGYTCVNGYRAAQDCATRYPAGVNWLAQRPFVTRDFKQAGNSVQCKPGGCCSTWLATQCGTNEGQGTLDAYVTTQQALNPPKGCCSPGFHPGATPTTTMGSSSSQCCVADVSNKCSAAGTEKNTRTGVGGDNPAILDVVCPGAGVNAWTKKETTQTATCTQAGPNRVVNDPGAYANVYACCVPPNKLDANVADTAETSNKNTDNWCKGKAGTALYGYGTTAAQNGRNGVLATTAATSTHVHNQLGSYESTPLSYVCPTTHSLKDYEAPKKEPNNCAEECVVRTDAWIDCIASPAQTETTACGVSTTWYGTKKTGYTNIGGLDGTGNAADGAVCPHSPNPCRCQEKVKAMYDSCRSCTGASYTVGNTNTPTATCPTGATCAAGTTCPIGSTCPPVVSSWGPAVVFNGITYAGKKKLFGNTIAADGSLTKGAPVTDQLWSSAVGGAGQASAALIALVKDSARTGGTGGLQGYGGICTEPPVIVCPPHVPEVGTKDTTAISQCPDPTTALSATTPTKVLAADACTAMPALATAMVVAVAAVVF